ncbi:MAG TPA: biopolymer transporter ExbD [Pontiella sp.]
MKLEPKNSGDDLELDMSPMIDMVFLLLIFFIVASQIIDEKPKLDKIPEAAYSKVAEDTTGRVFISVKKDGTYFVGTNKEELTIDEVLRQLAVESDNDPEGELKIVIRSESETPYKYNEKITLACAEVGFQDIIYAVFEE